MVHRSPDSERRSPPPAAPTPAELFRLLWNELTDILGSATAAILLRRSHLAAAGVSTGEEAEQLSITRDGLEYRYTVPAAWARHSASAMTELRVLVDQLRPLLVSLTGEVILRRLDAQPDFQRCGISFATPSTQAPDRSSP